MGSKYQRHYFTRGELALWSASILLITVSFCLFDRANYLALIASVVGATALIFNAKGNPIGQALTIVFSLLYGAISLSFSYYGEIITYLGMTTPMAGFALFSWLRNPHNGNCAEVRVNRLQSGEVGFMFFLAAVVTCLFYFILKTFQTAHLFVSTVSVATSFLAAYLTFRRSAGFTLAYAANDIVLILLWTLATWADIKYLSMVLCFAIFLANDIYGFINWKRMCGRQRNSA